MNHLEQQIHYPDLPLPETGELTPIAPGVFWLRMPLPFVLNHINLWLLEDELHGQKGWTVVDTGVATDETRAAWQLQIKNSFKGLPILRVLCTHFHPDHVGLAAWLCRGTDDHLWQAQLWMNLAEFSTAKIGSIPSPTDPNIDVPETSNMVQHFKRHGISDPDTLSQLRSRRNVYARLVPEVPLSFRRIFIHERIPIGGNDWEVIPGYGHSPEHSALFSAKLNLLISGDMVLPRISTNISVWAQEPDANPLKLYLDSLDRFDPLPDDVLILPSHGKPFGAAGRKEGGLKTRLTQLREHHRDRLAETVEACAGSATASDVLPVLFKRALDLHQLTFALGETIAHLNYLWHLGQLNRETDAEGRLRFSVRS